MRRGYEHGRRAWQSSAALSSCSAQRVTAARGQHSATSATAAPQVRERSSAWRCAGLQPGQLGLQSGRTGLQPGQLGLQPRHLGLQPGHMRLQPGHMGL